MNVNTFILSFSIVLILCQQINGCSDRRSNFEVENNASLGNDRVFESQIGLKGYREHIDTSVVFLIQSEKIRAVKEEEFQKHNHLWISIITDSLEIRGFGYNPDVVDELIISTKP